MNEDSVREILSLFSRTVWIITARHGDVTGGLVATFVNSASLVPSLPRLIVGIARHHHTWALIQRSRGFAAHLVDEKHCDLVWRFGLASGHDIDKMSGIEWNAGHTGSPLLKDALAVVDCSVEAELDIGDRTIYVGAIVDGTINRAAAPLDFKRVLELASEAQREQMREDRRRDEALDAEAMLAWRARRS